MHQTKEFPAEDMKNLMWEDHDPDRYVFLGKPDEVSGDKYVYGSVFFIEIDKNMNIYRLEYEKSGSNFSYWHYSYEDWGETVKCVQASIIDFIAEMLRKSDIRELVDNLTAQTKE